MIRVDGKGLIAAAKQVPSPNCDQWPTECQPELIILHGISLPPGQFGGSAIDELFTNRLDPSVHPYFAQICNIQVSSHLLVRRDGTLVQYVPLNMRAWHAGESFWNGRERCNDFSIGIELEGTDEMPYEDVQYATLAELILAICQSLPSLASGEVIGHCHVSPGRKTDPGPHFDWARFRRELHGQGT